MRKNKKIFEFKLGENKIRIIWGENIDYIVGIISAFIGIGLSSLITSLSGFNNKYFLVGFGLVFSFIILYRFGNSITKILKNNFRKGRK